MAQTTRVPLNVQVGLVGVLFGAALVALWTTYASVVHRESRRYSAKGDLDRAGEALATQGARLIKALELWPQYQDPGEWEAVDDSLRDAASQTLARFEGVEGGYYARDGHRFLGAAFPTEPRRPQVKKLRHRPPGPPPREADLIESQIDAAIRSNRVLFIIQDVPPSTVAIRTAPIVFNGRIVGATWTMTRLVDPLFLDRSLRGYQLAASFALGGIALALLLMVGLARTIRRQAIEREQLQSELRRTERLAALGKLLAGVAHEVRNPLAGIRSTTQLWQRGIGPDDESFSDLLAEVDRLDGIVARLLHFSKAETQDLAPGDLNAVVTEVARLARAVAESQKVQIEVNLAPSLPSVLMAAPALIQVLRNLATNALQVMPSGGRLVFGTRRCPDGGAVEVTVSDTGPGLSPEIQDHLFEPFFTTRSDGTGLGLAIAREIALAHGGELRAGNAQGAPGAVFTLVLPTAKVAAMREGTHASS